MADNKFLSIDDTTQQITEVLAKSTGGTGSENKIVQTGADGKLDVTFLPTGIGPEVYIGNAFENIADKEMVYVKDDGTVAKASGAAAGAWAEGWAYGAATAGQPCTVYFEGNITGLSSLTPRATYFLSASTPGGITATAPTGSSQKRQVVGVAISATVLQFTAHGDRQIRAA